MEVQDFKLITRNIAGSKRTERIVDVLKSEKLCNKSDSKEMTLLHLTVDTVLSLILVCFFSILYLVMFFRDKCI